MSRPLNFAVVGLGMGGHHCTAVRNAKGAHLAALCDIDEDRLAQHTKEFDCKGYSRYGDVLKDKSIDAVCIVVESGYHAELGIQAARAGKHIIMEKPVDITPGRIKSSRTKSRRPGSSAGVSSSHGWTTATS